MNPVCVRICSENLAQGQLRRHVITALKVSSSNMLVDWCMQCSAQCTWAAQQIACPTGGALMSLATWLPWVQNMWAHYFLCTHQAGPGCRGEARSCRHYPVVTVVSSLSCRHYHVVTATHFVFSTKKRLQRSHLHWMIRSGV